MSEIASEESLEPSGRDGVMLVRVNGRNYPAKQVKQCRTCRSKYRTQIEQAVINGMTYRAILNNVILPYDDHSSLGAPGYQSLQTHVVKKHMPLPFSTQRKIIEDRAIELGKSVEEGEALLVDSITIHRALVEQGFRRLNNGDIQVGMSDLIKVLQLQQATENGRDPNLDEDIWREALMEYMTIVRRNVTGDVLQRIGRDLAESPILQRINKGQPRTVSGEIAS